MMSNRNSKAGQGTGQSSVVRRMFGAEGGSATVEFVIWFPFYFMLLGLIGDTAVAFMNVNQMWNTARDTARRASVGEMTAIEAKI